MQLLKYRLLGLICCSTETLSQTCGVAPCGATAPTWVQASPLFSAATLGSTTLSFVGQEVSTDLPPVKS